MIAKRDIPAEQPSPGLKAGQGKLRLILLSASIGCCFAVAGYAAEQVAGQEVVEVDLTVEGEVPEGLLLPDDLEQKAAAEQAGKAVPNYTVEELRIGNRLERVTIHHRSGLDEVFENREVDSMMSNEENELGDMPNVRRWTLGSW